MVYVGATERKRIEILHLCDTMQALYAFNYQLSDNLKDELKARREVAKTATVRELRELRAALDIDIQRAVDAFGCIEQPAKFAAAFKSESRVTMKKKLDSQKIKLSKSDNRRKKPSPPLSQFFAQSPLAKANLDLERIPDYGRKLKIRENS